MQKSHAIVIVVTSAHIAHAKLSIDIAHVAFVCYMAPPISFPEAAILLDGSGNEIYIRYISSPELFSSAHDWRSSGEPWHWLDFT